MAEKTQASIHAVRAIQAANIEVACCANIGALLNTEPGRRLRALTVGHAAVRLALCAFEVLEKPDSSEKVDALYGELFAAYDISETLLGPSQWTPYSSVLSVKVNNQFDPRFIDTTNIAPGDTNDCIEAWAWRNLRLYFNEAHDKFEEALSAECHEAERRGVCKRLVTLGVKAELALWAMRTKNTIDICETIDEILTIERDFMDKPRPQPL